MVTGSRFSMMLDLTTDDVAYVAMPLFHSNAVMVGWAPSIVAGASVGLARKFTASGWLPDVRRYGATWFNYTGKPLSYILATPEQPDDADNPLRVAFGNEGSSQVDGENFPAGPVEAAVARHPDVVIAAVYGVPDEQAGDQVMAALILRDGASFDPARFAQWLDSQADVGPKWRPRYVRVSEQLPAT